jgi:ABC-type dipeptide/oligopeptide/nickel transport system permease component
MTLLGYFLRRFAASVLTVLMGASVIFLMVHLIPGDPVAMLLQDQFTPETAAAMRARLGLDRPLADQYLTFMRNVAIGRLGLSFRSDRPVARIIAEQFPATAELALAATAVAVGIGVPLGMVAAVHRGSPLDYLTMGGALLAICVPSFVLGLGLLLVFSYELGWVPMIGAGAAGVAETARALVLPALVLGLRTAALLSRVSRSSLLNVLGLEFIRTAHAKGAPRRSVLYRHALRNSVLPVITILGVTIGHLLAGTAIVEVVFSRPGIGKLLVDAVLSRDLPQVQGTLIVFLVIVIVVNAAVDVVYSLVDPRISYA